MVILWLVYPCFFERVKAIDNEQDNPDHQLFAKEVSNCAGHSLSLDIWSAKV